MTNKLVYRVRIRLITLTKNKVISIELEYEEI